MENKGTNNNVVICIGELLIDFFCTDIDVGLEKGTNFLKKAGGAPANVAAAIAKLGGSSSFVGKVGDDPFGSFLKRELDTLNVDTSMLVLDSNFSTTMAFVSLKANGERDFVFNRGADRLLHYHELDLEKISSAKIIHFGSATALLDNPFQETYFKLMEFAKQQGIFVSFDPNYRANLWGDRKQEYIELARKSIKYAEFVKVSEEELELISGTSDKLKGVEYLHRLGAKVVAVTLGKDGTLLSNGKEFEAISSIMIKSIDSTGAGDAFVGATLFQMAKLSNLENIYKYYEELKKIIAFSNRVAAITCTKIGAIDSLPNLNEVTNYN